MEAKQVVPHSYRTQFDYLLNAFEEASQSSDPDEHGYGAKREALFEYVRALENRSNGPKSEPLVKAWNESVQRGLKHEFFQDGLAADTYELQPWQAYVEGWRDAWLESADDLHNATKDGKP